MDFYISNMLRKVMIYFTPQVGTFTFNINIWWPTFAYQWQYLTTWQWHYYSFNRWKG